MNTAHTRKGRRSLPKGARNAFQKQVECFPFADGVDIRRSGYYEKL